jgi:flagellar assembly protein FliH
LTDLAFARVDFPTVGGTGSSAAGASAHAAGHSAGFAAGRREAEIELEIMRARLQQEAADRADRDAERVASAIDALLAGAALFVDRVAPVAASLDAGLLAAAVEIAESMIGVELRDDETSALSVTSRILDRIDPAEVRRIRISPRDLQTIEELGLLEGQPLVGDPSLGPGDAVAELVEGVLDARIAQSAARVRAELTGVTE